MRLDQYMTDAALVKSRTRAKECIEGGFVTVNGTVILKPSYPVGEQDSVVLTGQPHPFVGRGGLKLDGALRAFAIDVRGLVCADIGASTGGFTDCLLRRGAAHVYAVDSGRDQLDPSLRADSRVTNIEHFNARDLTPDTFGVLCDIAVADLSFISQTLVHEGIRAILKDGGLYVGLIKPQFECGPRALDRHGIVKDPADHMAAIRRVRDSAASTALYMQKLIVSPITGGDGNREFLCLCRRGDASSPVLSDSEIRKVVKS